MLISPKSTKAEKALSRSVNNAFDKIFLTPSKSLHNPTHLKSKFNTDAKRSIAYLKNSIAKTNINTTWNCIVNNQNKTPTKQIPLYFVNLGNSIGNLIHYTQNQAAMIKNIEEYHQIRRIV